MIEVKFNTGNFSMEVKGEFAPDKQAEALESALKYILQRDVASKVYIALAGVAGKKADKVLPEGFERESVKFDERSKNQFANLAMAELEKLGTFEVSVTEYVKGESNAEAGKEAKKDAERYIKEGKADKVAEAIAKRCGFVVEDLVKTGEGNVVASEANIDRLAKGITALNRHMLAEARKAKEALLA